MKVFIEWFNFVAMEEKYISIKETCELFNKSLSTIRRLIKDIPTNKLKYEKLPTGHKKIFIDRDYLNDYFKEPIQQTNSSSEVPLNDSNERLIETLENVIKMLNNELESKNKQLQEKDKQIESLIERQRENNILISSFSQVKQIEGQDKKKRWWNK